MTQRLGPCPQNCQDRYANEHETCHSTCQRYMRYKLTKLLEGKQRMKAVDVEKWTAESQTQKVVLKE